LSAGRALQKRLLAAIEALRPGVDEPEGTPAATCYHLLRLRFVDGLELAAVRKELALGRSEFFREQQRAIAAVASALDAGKKVGSANASRSSPSPVALSSFPLVALSSFIGRARELEELGRLL